MKRVFGIFEAVFNVLYLLAASALGIILMSGGASGPSRTLAGIMALILVAGDSFHLVPRVAVIHTGAEEKYRRALGRGKQATSISMSVFYLLLWRLGVMVISPDIGHYWSYLIYFLTILRILLCLLPQNKWTGRYPPVGWGIVRNIPFFIAGIIVAGLFFAGRNTLPGLGMMWLAVLLSFAFYLPVVLWSNKKPKVGMLMLPKTCAYIWMLVMCLSL